MLRELLARYSQGHRTGRYPLQAPVLPDRFRGRPELDPEACPPDCRACVDACPAGAIEGQRIDLGRCLFCGCCAEACAPGAIRFSSDYQLASLKREELVTRGAPPGAVVRADAQRWFGRSFRLRQVSAGGCNACEADANVLGTLAFDMGRFGVEFVASPRHADALLVTGPVSKNMALALRKTYDATPDPKLVIAAGACAISGGPFRGCSEVAGGAATVVPVDLWVPGCPPHPYTLLEGLLGLIGRVAR
jgi:Ni,Fe-hydrogenase III small subunit/Pyruvate/2-oxoacid:ferredoxin oxidoreductase delta subunit